MVDSLPEAMNHHPPERCVSPTRFNLLHDFRRLMLGMALLLSGLLHAQPASPLRIAIVPAAGTPPELADLLTVELSQKPSLQLVERTEVARILREQSRSALSRDPLRIGQLLKADGLLLLDTSGPQTNRSLHSRLLAVRSGVLLGASRSPASIPDPVGWVSSILHRYDPLFAKLGVSPDDAIPISMVNLRAAVSSAASRDLERQLTLLAIERLSLDRRLFVLERRRLDLLADEKDLQPTDEPFWNGRYLLEGTIDRDGSSADTLRLDLRLTGPGGSPTSDISLQGPRDQLPALMDRLAARVLEVLLRPAEPVVWKPDAEATRFLDEARWAFKWSLWPEARAASDTAWALGRHDLDTALVRVRALLPELIQNRTMYAEESVSAELRDSDAALRRVFALDPGALPRVLTNDRQLRIEYWPLTPPPTPIQIQQATRALGLYNEFSATLPGSEPKPASDWTLAGIESLSAAGPILQGALLNPKVLQAQAEDLASLRTEARRAEARLLASTSIRAQYWGKDGSFRGMESPHQLAYSTNVFKTLVTWGPFWRETPEDCVDLWRLLMSSPLFTYIHSPFWIRVHNQPVVLGWTPTDRLRAHGVWTAFVSELAASTNFLHRLEAKSIAVAATHDFPSRKIRSDELIETFQSHRDDFVNHPLNLLANSWDWNAFRTIRNPTGQRDEIVFTPELNAFLDQVAQARGQQSAAAPTRRARSPIGTTNELFAARKAFLTTMPPGSYSTFTELFGTDLRAITATEAEELKPLLESFSAKVREQPQLLTDADPAWGNAQRASMRLRMLQSRLNMVTRRESAAQPTPTSPGRTEPPPTASIPTPSPLAAGQGRDRINRATRDLSRPGAVPQSATPVPPPTEFPLVNATQFVPLTDILYSKRPKPFDVISVAIADIHATEDSVWVDARSRLMELTANGRRISNKSLEYAGWVRWDRKSGRWSLVAEMPVPHRTGIIVHPSSRWLGNTLYLSLWDSLRRWSATGTELPAIPVPWQAPPVLFALHDRLYGMSQDAVYEIPTDGGDVRILASTRRRPATTPLDSIEKFDKPFLMEGPGDSILALAGERLHQWNGTSWSSAFPHPVVSANAHGKMAAVRGLLERPMAAVWMLPLESLKPTLAFAWNGNNYGPGLTPGRLDISPPTFEPGKGPAWNLPHHLAGSQATYLPLGKDLLVCIDELPEVTAPPPQSATHHALVSLLESGTSTPRTFRLLFDAEKGPLPYPGPQINPSSLEQRPRLRLRVMGDELLVFHSWHPGFWRIPLSEFQSGSTPKPSRAKRP